MTPVQKHGATPLDEWCYHEIGHLYIALCKGVPADINFFASGPNGAVTYTSWARANSPQNLIVGSLAGAYAHALYAPRTIHPSLRESLLTLEFYEQVVVTRNVLNEADFIYDDLTIIERVCAKNADTSERKIKMLRTAFEHLQKLFANEQREAIFRSLHRDVQTWLHEEIPEADTLSPMSLYSYSRSKPIFESFQR